MEVSKLAENIIGSEIIKLAAEVNQMLRKGEKIHNLTIGDFNPQEFPIPAELKQFVSDEYFNDETNYPPSDGVAALRKSVSELYRDACGLDYATDEILVAAGARPLIYSAYRTLVDSGDLVLYPVPSWNNNHYSYLNGARSQPIETTEKKNFMPSAEDLRLYIDDATLIALCSPQNPTGTVFTKKGLEDICDLILEENKKRNGKRKPVYLMYDQIYWTLTFDGHSHYNPVSLRPEMRDYTVFIDGISKSLAATGLRVGWAAGPKFIIAKMKAILTHIGAWAPRPEQLATAKYLSQKELYNAFLKSQKEKIYTRLKSFYKGFMDLKKDGFNVDAVEPQAAIYLTVRISLKGKKKSDGSKLETTDDVTNYLLHEARIGLVPFYAFGAEVSSDWYRLSVGACRASEISDIISSLRTALAALS